MTLFPRWRRLSNARAALVALVMLALAGCLGEDVCDPGEHEKVGGCFADKKPGSGAKDAAASDDDAGAIADAAKSRAYEHFGDTCKMDDECAEPAPTCLGPLGYCSLTQCAGDAEACPPGWTCQDVSAASTDPNVTHVCLKP